MKKLLIAVISFAVALCTVSCNVIITSPETSAETTEEVTETEKVYPHSNMELAPLDDVIATTDHLSIKAGTFKYFFMDQYSAFINKYYYMLLNYNFDESIPLHDQEYDNGTEIITWYQFFLDNAKGAFEQYVKFAEKALSEGMELDEADKTEIEENLDSIEKTAKEYSETFEEYMAQFMGEGMTRERVKEAFELTKLGYKYYQKVYNDPKYTEEQIEEEYSSGNGKYALVDFYEAKISALYDETDTDEKVTAAKAEVKEKAEKMKGLIEGGMSFADAYNTVTETPQTETEAVSETEASTDTADGTAAETEAEEAEEKADKYLYTGVEYIDEDSYKFLYEEGVKEGQINISYDDSGNATVVQCVKPPYKNTQKTVNVRHILLSQSDYDTEEEAYEAAQKILKQIDEAADKKAEFIKLVPEYSSDTGSKTSGGLYEKVTPGKMITEFNDWCFDSERQIGDTGIVRTTYGYHVMYLDGFGDEIWHIKCEEEMRNTDFQSASQQIYDSVKITYNEDLLDKIAK